MLVTSPKTSRASKMIWLGPIALQIAWSGREWEHGVRVNRVTFGIERWRKP